MHTVRDEATNCGLPASIALRDMHSCFTFKGHIFLENVLGVNCAM